jgi:hypothetical protein
MVRVAVIGAGYWGPNLVRNLIENPLCTDVTVCDVDAERLRRILRRYPGVCVTTDPAEVFASTKIDAVMIATPPKTHFELARETLRHGKHVFVEKPFTLSSEDAVRLPDNRDPKKSKAQNKNFLFIKNNFLFHTTLLILFSTDSIFLFHRRPRRFIVVRRTILMTRIWIFFCLRQFFCPGHFCVQVLCNFGH